MVDLFIITWVIDDYLLHFVLANGQSKLVVIEHSKYKLPISDMVIKSLNMIIHAQYNIQLRTYS